MKSRLGDMFEYRISSVGIGVVLRLPKHEEVPVVVNKHDRTIERGMKLAGPKLVQTMLR